MEDSEDDRASSTVSDVLAKIRLDEEAEEEGKRARVQRTYADYKDTCPQDDLCQRCAGINWSNLLFHESVDYCHSGNGEMVGVPESSLELSVSSCPLCRLLGSDQNFNENPSRTLHARCICRDYLYLGEDGRWTPDNRSDMTQHTPSIWLVDSGSSVYTHFPSYILQDTRGGSKNYVVRNLDPGGIDYSILRQWLSYCKLYHASSCHSSSPSPIPGLRVIDCNTGKVVAAVWDASFEYLALSYVWGSTPASKEQQTNFPATICDAITVTLELGYRYLWVDQYVRCSRDMIAACGHD